MVKRTKSQWRSLFEAHDASGLSASVFCKQNKLCPKYFSLRRKQLLGGEPKKAPRTFVKVQPPKSCVSSSGDVRLRIGRVDLHFTSTSPNFIVAVVTQLA